MSSITDLCDVTILWDPVTGERLSEEEWHKLRKVGIGGSDMGTLCGENKYGSRYELWCLKTGRTMPTDAGEPAQWGHDLEAPVAINYARATGKALVEWPVILRSKAKPYLSANLDYLVVEPSEQFPAGKVTEWLNPTSPSGVLGIYEGKTTGIASPGNPHHWDSGACPSSYLIQCMHYMGICGLPKTWVGCLIGGKGLVKREIDFDPQFFADLEKIADDFWQLVLDDVAPEPDGSDATEEALKSQYPRSAPGEVYEGGTELALLWESFEQAKQAAKDADDYRKACRSKIVALMGKAEYGYGPDGTALLSYKSSKDGESFDQAAFKAAHPDLWSAFLKERPGIRTLRAVG